MRAVIDRNFSERKIGGRTAVGVFGANRRLVPALRQEPEPIGLCAVTDCLHLPFRQAFLDFRVSDVEDMAADPIVAQAVTASLQLRGKIRLLIGR